MMLAEILNVNQQNSARIYLNSIDVQKKFWLGLTDEASEGNYVWAFSQTLATYLPWKQYTPMNTPSINCVRAAYDDVNRNWIREGCSSTNVYAFCQKGKPLK